MSSRQLAPDLRSDRGAVVWITGLPCSGKSTLARRLHGRLRASGRSTVLLDGDEMRGALVPSPGYDAEGRAAFYATLARLAVLVERQGLVAIVASTSNLRQHRQLARDGAERFVEVLVATPADECARRDDKGLWARAAAGLAPHLPGAGAPYESPVAPEVTASGGRDDEALAAILRRLR
jgi:adenylylsulfate kinase